MPAVFMYCTSMHRYVVACINCIVRLFLTLGEGSHRQDREQRQGQRQRRATSPSVALSLSLPNGFALSSHREQAYGAFNTHLHAVYKHCRAHTDQPFPARHMQSKLVAALSSTLNLLSKEISLSNSGRGSQHFETGAVHTLYLCPAI